MTRSASAILPRRRVLALSALPLAMGGVAHAAHATASFTDIVAGPARVPLLEPDHDSTAVWAYGGSVPGPVLRVRQGGTLRVRLRNGLSEPTTIHWHGIRIDNAMDGVAGLTQAPVPPGQQFDYEFRVPDAGTYWYHPHYRSWEQLARGLHGLLIVEEAEPPAVDRDVALVFDDWRVTEAGEIDTASFGAMMDRSHAGRLGNVLTVNGESYPELTVRAGERVRLRLVNVATARVMSLSLKDHAATLIALDGQPVLPRVLDHASVTLAPAQRADIIIDMMAAPGSTHEIVMAHRNGDVGAATIRYVDDARLRDEPAGPVVALPANPLAEPVLADPLEVKVNIQGGAMGRMRSAVYEGRELGIRELVGEGMAWALNGVAGRTDTPLFRAPPGRTVVVTLRNEGRWRHGMHFHGHHVLELERNGQPVAHRDWRDTVLLDSEETCRVAFVADNPGRWMLHCHMLDHQAAGMSTWYEVAA